MTSVLAAQTLVFKLDGFDLVGTYRFMKPEKNSDGRRNPAGRSSKHKYKKDVSAFRLERRWAGSWLCCCVPE